MSKELRLTVKEYGLGFSIEYLRLGESLGSVTTCSCIPESPSRPPNKKVYFRDYTLCATSFLFLKG